MKRHMLFFDSCGCPSGSAPLPTPCPVFPVVGALICDDRYYSLIEASNIKLLGVQIGSNCQAFLTSEFRGFAFYGTDGQVSITETPQLTLPYVNPAVSSSYPATGTAATLLVGNGADPQSWQMLHAPTTGTWYLQAVGGTFSLVSPGDAPAINAIFGAASTLLSLEMMGFVQTGTDGLGAPIFSVRKLGGTGTGDQVTVLRYNGTTGRFELTGLLSSDTLSHKKIQFNTLFGQNDDGTDTAGGFLVRPNSGIVQADIYGLSYDTGTKKVYRSAANTNAFIQSNTDSGSQAATTWVQPTGHLSFGAKTINYPNVKIAFFCTFKTDETPKFALYIDGSPVITLDYSTTTDKTMLYSGAFLVTGLSLGSHTFDIRVYTVTTFHVMSSSATFETLAD